VRELLRVEIVQQLRRGDLLPSEWELVATFDASRGVVRAALELLRGEGLIDRLQGAGTFVVSPWRETFAIDEQGAMTKHIDEFDARARWELLEYARVKAPALIAGRLGIADGVGVLHAERRAMFDGEPLLIRSSWIPPQVADLLTIDPTTERWSTDDLVERAIGGAIECTHLRVEATIVDTSTADALGLPEGSPLVLLERLVVDSAGRPVEFGHSRVRADRVALTTVMRRPTMPGPDRPPAKAGTAELDAQPSPPTRPECGTHHSTA
jgi:GntR family transcriptional regulator